MERTYHLDLLTLLGYIQGKSAVLRTTITLARNKPSGQGILFLLHTNKMYCYVLSQTGTLLLEGDTAYKRLSQSTEWQVCVDTEQVINQEWLAWLQQHNPMYNPPVLDTSEIIPKPKRALDALILRKFTHQQALLLRAVFSSVNGQRTVEQIKNCLPQSSPQMVDDALNVLRTLGVIE